MARVAAGWYSSADVCVLAGCTYRQLDSWCRLGLVTPSVTEANGQGTRRRWSSDDVVRVRRVVAASQLAGATLIDVLDRLDELGVAV
jgi:DNA-binding transcriptional MerR regulator